MARQASSKPPDYSLPPKAKAKKSKPPKPPSPLNPPSRAKQKTSGGNPFSAPPASSNVPGNREALTPIITRQQGRIVKLTLGWKSQTAMPDPLRLRLIERLEATLAAEVSTGRVYVEVGTVYVDGLDLGLAEKLASLAPKWVGEMAAV